jgi:hypothetical protein
MIQPACGVPVRLHKIKRPAGVHRFDVLLIGTDEFGTWLFAPRGAGWQAPHASGRLGFDVLVLLASGRPYVAWWCADPDGRRLEIDICLPPEPAADGWTFVDLELDVFRHEDTAWTEIVDQDEFDVACRAGLIDQEAAHLALATANELHAHLRGQVEPFGHAGWRKLTALQADQNVRPSQD